MKLKIINLLLSVIAFIAVSSCSAEKAPVHEVEVEIIDPVDQPVYSWSENPLTLRLNSKHKEAQVEYHWVDFQGKALSEKKRFPLNQIHSLNRPSKLPGYYGLLLTPARHIRLADREAGEPMEYGFSNQQRVKNHRINEQRFGTVHSHREDPFLPTWIKTLTWKTMEPRWWAPAMAERRRLQQQELPIIVEDEWQSDDRVAISDEQLAKLKEKVSQYFRADRSTIYWELGLEENLDARFRQKYYWKNLTRKAQQVKQVAAIINPEIKLIYQIAGVDNSTVRSFLQSTAAAFFDVLSVHPYAWPDFPDPDQWLADFLQQIKTDMRELGQVKPIWFTEVGAPHHGHHSSQFFGYPEDNNSVQGVSRRYAVEYMIKLHVIAFHQGVKKIFWYNYRDREAEREYAENHFGLVDFRGYAKPVYSAYVHLYQRLNGKVQVKQRSKNSKISDYEFGDGQSQIRVVWSKRANMIDYKIEKIRTVYPVEIVNAVGTPIKPVDGKITIGKDPVYFVY